MSDVPLPLIGGGVPISDAHKASAGAAVALWGHSSCQQILGYSYWQRPDTQYAGTMDRGCIIGCCTASAQTSRA